MQPGPNQCNILVYLHDVRGQEVGSVRVVAYMTNSVARVMREACNHFHVQLSRYNVRTGILDLDDFDGTVQQIDPNMQPNVTVHVDMWPKSIDDCF